MRTPTQIALVAGASLLAFAGVAQAQTESKTWDGFYVGVTAGASKGDLHIRNAPLYTANPSAFFGTYGGTVANSSPTYEVKGGEYGVTAGHNWQRGRWVYGVEMDGSGSQADGSLRLADRPAAGTNQFSTALDTDIDYSATLRGRLGYTFGPLMVYGTAGGAAMGVNFKRNYANAAGATLSGSAQHDYTGTAYGAGAEYALGDRWSIKGEYLRLDVNDEDIATYYSDGTRASATVDLDRDVLRAGLNYRF